jgi:purine nucleosidase
MAAAVGRCIVMGGAPCCEGNVTPAAEFNVWVDPEAARIVFSAGMSLEMVGWHLCRGEAALNKCDIEDILALKNPLAEFAIRCNSTAAQAYFKQTGEKGISLPDPVAMSIALNPALCASSSTHFVDIETSSDLTRGMTVVDRLNVAVDSRNTVVWARALERQSKAHICWSLDIPGWKVALRRALS